MALVKLAAAARKARAGSVKTIGRELREAGIPLVEIGPGSFAVEEADLDRFLQNRLAGPAQSPAASRQGGPRKKPKPDRRR